MRHGLFALLLPLCACGAREPVYGPNAPTGHSVVLVTLDGVRWQELFDGEDPVLSRDGQPIFTRFWAEVAPLGRVYGDVRAGHQMRVANGSNASLPGYMSIYAEQAQGCATNACERIGVPTFLDRLHDELELERAQLQVVAAWPELELAATSRDDVAVVQTRGTHPAGEGGEIDQGLRAEGFERDRLPVMTARESLEARPRFLHLGLLDSDRFGHQGNYEKYVRVLRAYDRLFVELSQRLDDDTALVITTDHGRGLWEQWSDHGPHVPASARVWAFVMLPRAARDLTLVDPAARKFDHHDVRYTIETLFGLGTAGSRGFIAEP